MNKGGAPTFGADNRKGMDMFRTDLTIFGMLIFTGPLQAQSAAEIASATRPSLAETFIAGNSVEDVPWAAWDIAHASDSEVVSVSGRAAVQSAPESASRYSKKSYVFPTGTIWVLDFRQNQGGMIHELTNETALYMLKGEGMVDAAGERVTVKQGDVVSYPSGVLRGRGDATVLAWAVFGTTAPDDSKPMLVRSTDATLRQIGYWPSPDGERVVATTAEELKNAPPTAIRLDILTYAFDGNAVAVTTNYKGGPTNKTTGDRDALLYITSGKMRFFQDDIDVIAEPGDAIRESAGRAHNWIRLEDSSFVGIGTSPLADITVENPNDYTGRGVGK